MGKKETGKERKFGKKKPQKTHGRHKGNDRKHF